MSLINNNNFCCVAYIQIADNELSSIRRGFFNYDKNSIINVDVSIDKNSNDIIKIGSDSLDKKCYFEFSINNFNEKKHQLIEAVEKGDKYCCSLNIDSIRKPEDKFVVVIFKVLIK